MLTFISLTLICSIIFPMDNNTISALRMLVIKSCVTSCLLHCVLHRTLNYWTVKTELIAPVMKLEKGVVRELLDGCLNSCHAVSL